jgi:DNA polymerase III alpha subunit
MVPLFTSHYSIGKSILTLDHPDKQVDGGSTSVFSIAQKNNLSEIFLVENSLTGFPQALSISAELGIQLCFGLLLQICEQDHKVVIFAKNSKGCARLNQIYSEAFGGDGECLSCENLKKAWNDKDLMLYIPFYDSFIYKNIMTFDSCTPDFASLNPTFFIEENGLPFDDLIKSKVEAYAASMGHATQLAKSIYYEHKEDAESLQTYKCICSRRFGKSSLSKPNLDHFGSNEFCFESLSQGDREAQIA